MPTKSAAAAAPLSTASLSQNTRKLARELDEKPSVLSRDSVLTVTTLVAETLLSAQMPTLPKLTTITKTTCVWDETATQIFRRILKEILHLRLTTNRIQELILPPKKWENCTASLFGKAAVSGHV